jgi:hypothetical protein
VSSELDHQIGSAGEQLVQILADRRRIAARLARIADQGADYLDIVVRLDHGDEPPSDRAKADQSDTHFYSGYSRGVTSACHANKGNDYG